VLENLDISERDLISDDLSLCQQSPGTHAIPASMPYWLHPPLLKGIGPL
jgi:hypothetical protein